MWESIFELIKALRDLNQTGLPFVLAILAILVYGGNLLSILFTNKSLEDRRENLKQQPDTEPLIYNDYTNEKWTMTDIIIFSVALLGTLVYLGSLP